MTDDIRLNSLKVVLLAQLLVEAIDDVRATNLYNGKLKQHANTVCNILTPMLKKQVFEVYKEDPELTTNLFNEIDNLIQKLSKLNVVDLTIINQITQMYVQNPEKAQQQFPIQLNTLLT
ncbi:hypothetical protein ACFQZW_13025 [Lutibacter aestuarii]|uniref:Uncharacterized protein n=1 Tax=Lutibacter aestuarii TaxID=861111 RepID=A0ABW2Z8T8_9FLAO